jgi:hypothetical protein
MKTSFGAEFASAAREGPKLFFAPLASAIKAAGFMWRRLFSPKRTKDQL